MYKFNIFALFATLALIQNVADAQFRNGGRPTAGGDRPTTGRGRPIIGGGRGRPGSRPGGNRPGRNVTVVDLGCEVLATDPVCPDDRNGEPGLWVCRQGFDRRTRNMTEFSTCTSANRTLSTDECGCCEPDGCPQLCQCACDLMETGDGVLVKGENSRTGTTMTRCMDPSRALRKITRASERYSCDTSCLDEN